jgi:hypothetical protein
MWVWTCRRWRPSAAHLNSDGNFVVSLWESLDGELAGRRASSALRVLDETYLRNGAGTAWRVRLCAPKAERPVA